MLGSIGITIVSSWIHSSHQQLDVLLDGEVIVILGSKKENTIVYVVSTQSVVTVFGRYNHVAAWYDLVW